VPFDIAGAEACAEIATAASCDGSEHRLAHRLATESIEEFLAELAGKGKSENSPVFAGDWNGGPGWT
jgi:hypothetical protein